MLFTCIDRLLVADLRVMFPSSPYKVTEKTETVRYRSLGIHKS